MRVALVLYDAPSGEGTVANPYLLGTQVTEYAQLTPGSTVYLEAWVATEWADGLTGAGVDVTYAADVFFTYCNPVDPTPPCMVDLGKWHTFASHCPLFYRVPDRTCSGTENRCIGDIDCLEGGSCVDNPAKDCVPVPGVVQDVGGNNFEGLPPTAGMWERIATIDFDVLATPTTPVAFVSGQDQTWGGGTDWMLAFYGGGEALASEINFFDWDIPGGADVDDDGLFSAMDNCPRDYNPNQEDGDLDGVGDVCDNCPNDLNPDQADFDDDGTGDACDEDADDDGVLDDADACPLTPLGAAVDEEGRPLGDIDRDCDTDLTDYRLFQRGFTGTGR